MRTNTSFSPSDLDYIEYTPKSEPVRLTTAQLENNLRILGTCRSEVIGYSEDGRPYTDAQEIQAMIEANARLWEQARQSAS